MTVPIKLYHAMKALRDARDLIEASANQCDNEIEKINLDDWAEDLTGMLWALEQVYGELAA